MCTTRRHTESGIAGERPRSEGRREDRLILNDVKHPSAATPCIPPAHGLHVKCGCTRRRRRFYGCAESKWARDDREAK